MDLALPNLHPAVVHFPLVLIPLALVLDALSAARRTAVLDRIAAMGWLIAGLAATAAFVAGRFAADGLVDLDPTVQPALGAHADWAWWTLVMVWTVALLRGGAVTFSTRPPVAMALRSLVFVGAVVLQGVLFATADKGGALVYRHGVAVERPECPTCPAPEAPQPTDGSLTLQDQDGTLIWTPGGGEGAQLGASEWPASGVALGVRGSQTVLLPPTLGDVQVNAWLDLSHFEGEVWVLHHYNGSTGGALVASPRAGARLVDLAPDETVLDQSADALPSRAALSVSAAGAHFKGLVNGKVVVHGHAKARAPGQVGLRFVGEGVVAIERLEVIRLEGAD